MSIRRISKVTAGTILIALGTSSSAQAQFTEIRIGDVDGFGYGTAVGWLGAAGTPANRTGGLLSGGDLLPDITGDGILATGVEVPCNRPQTRQGDDFDFRSSAEIQGNFITGNGFTNVGSTGSQFTDISISASYDCSSGRGDVLVNPTFNAQVFGTGNPIPLPPSFFSPNQPGFQFQFDVNKGDILKDRTLFFNVLFGDYDVTPATLNVTINNGSGGAGSTINLPLTVQPPNQDGLIQAAFTTLGFSEVFSDGGAVWNGFLGVDFNAPNEPYTTFDFVEVSLNPITPQSTPEPSSALGLLVLSTLGAGSTFLRKKRQ